ncbi:MULTISPECIES: ABC transporter permease [Erysipelotrichaceae]|jgi:iron(III) transport system permease protein|nr:MULTISPECIES: iron ABC transporter permease [Erysipelotrichaceae]MCI2154073.1 iron ABC transporter permease [Solobacterium sp.]MDY3233679.1 iron ABC transporter permease [Erysipelotrichaceae bacterium]MDY4681581.1 iron ABC transporter permease [Lachnospiraceae bacterium]MDD5880822.1 iron ABC transporter permease [Stecheria intestinalis]MDD6366851.1 iron ABC transporter permease [Stecheria intestinalis]
MTAMEMKSSDARKSFDIWKGISWGILALYALFLIYPLIRLLISAVYVDGHFTLEYFGQFFAKKYYTSTIWNSLKVSFMVTLVSLVIGVPLAYFYTMYDLKGKRVLQVLIILCSMSAPFIGAYSWILLLGRSGLITGWFKSIGITLPTIYGFRGIFLVQALQLFPLVFLYVCGGLKNVDQSLLEASENLGCTSVKRFFTVVIPLCMPTILASALLVFMRAFADFGTPLLIGEGYRTFPVIIYNAYFSEVGTNHSFGAAVSVIAIVITTVIFLIQNYANSKFQFTMNALHPIERHPASGAKSFWMNFFAWAVVLIAFMPQVYVMYTSFKKTSGKLFTDGYSLDSYRTAFASADRAIPNTFIIGIEALAITVIIAILIAYLVVRRKNKTNEVIDTLSMVPYIIPGSVIGIALVIAFSSKPLVLTGTAVIMVIALVIRRMPYTIRSSVAILQQIPMSIEEAAISLGSSKMKAFFQITVPMMGNGILSGAILSWVTIITELSTAIILYNLKTITLTLEVYINVTRGSYGVAAAYATILTATTIISLLLFMKFSKNKEISF